MKKITQVLAALLIAVSMSAQSNVILKIDHFLGSNPFAFNTAATNNLGNSFNVNRLQYYIAEIKITHDGGQVTPVPNTWILANANSSVNENLGSFNINSVEAISFGIGVEQSANHLDPASYPMSHPLAPKSPSMHWGWSAGYRFVAMEGKTGAGLNQTYEFHALGDANYHILTIPTSGTVSGSDIVISVNADIEKAFYNIDLSSGNNLIHGEVGKAADLLVNFAYHVFTSSEGNASMSVGEIDALSLNFYPNPSNGVVFIEGNLEGKTIEVYDALGNLLVNSEIGQSQREEISIETPGMYFINILESGELLKSEKMMIVK